MRRRASAARIASLALGLFLLAGTPAAQAEGAQAPRHQGLTSDPVVVDFGSVERGLPFNATYRVINVSNATVTLNAPVVTHGYPPGVSLREYHCMNPGPLRSGGSRECLLGGRSYIPGVLRATVTFTTSDPKVVLDVPVKVTVVDPVAPTWMSGPTPKAVARAYPASMGLVTPRWFWQADDDYHVDRFTTQVRVGDGGWQRVEVKEPVNETSSPRYAWQAGLVTIPVRKPVTIRTRALDTSGNPCPWSELTVKATYRDIAVDDSLTGAWREVRRRGTAGAYGKDIVVTNENDATASITANARVIALIGRVGPRQGDLKVPRVDDPSPDVVDLEARKTKDLQVLHSWAWDDVAPRTVSVKVRTAFGPIVSLDAWVVIE